MTIFFLLMYTVRAIWDREKAAMNGELAAIGRSSDLVLANYRMVIYAVKNVGASDKARTKYLRAIVE